MKNKPELRMINVDEAEMRVDESSEGPKITGYAAVFNRKSQDLGGFQEIIRPGAFRKVIESADIRALFNHNPDFVLGRVQSGTLRLEENTKGLRFEITPPDSQLVRDMVIEPIKRGDIDGCSFSFNVTEDGERWQRQGDEMMLREVLEVGNMRDVGPVTYPAYLNTSVNVRSAQDVYNDYLASQRALEQRQNKQRGQRVLAQMAIKNARKTLKE